MDMRPRALVTGSGRRLGRELALALGRAGYDLALHAHRSVDAAAGVAQELAAMGSAAEVFAADLSSTPAATEMIEAVTARGPLTLLVNSAGVIGTAAAEDRDAAELDAAYELNVRAPYLLSLHAAKALTTARGSIVNVASVGGERPYAKHPAYSISKAALLMQTRVLARVLAPHVRVNAVAPGTVWMEGQEDDAVGKPPASSIPLGRYGAPENVTAAVLYLATAAWVTGATLRVDGGAGV